MEKPLGVCTWDQSCMAQWVCLPCWMWASFGSETSGRLEVLYFSQVTLRLWSFKTLILCKGKLFLGKEPCPQVRSNLMWSAIGGIGFYVVKSNAELSGQWFQLSPVLNDSWIYFPHFRKKTRHLCERKQNSLRSVLYFMTAMKINLHLKSRFSFHIHFKISLKTTSIQPFKY